MTKPLPNKNPIPFNPEGMTARQLFDCADTLSHLYNNLERIDALPEGEERTAFVENLLHNMRDGRDYFSRKWGNA